MPARPSSAPSRATPFRRCSSLSFGAVPRRGVPVRPADHRYAFEDIKTAIADTKSGKAVKAVLTMR
ncbi:hypothetical protein [Aeromicrobium sp. UC242_57]|uniref:hypothetical protein n=1 Tax=Aeromicrobium sp. UC242_57 TaxID=3374624 RepID=UPI0037B1FDA4